MVPRPGLLLKNKNSLGCVRPNSIRKLQRDPVAGAPDFCLFFWCSRLFLSVNHWEHINEDSRRRLSDKKKNPKTIHLVTLQVPPVIFISGFRNRTSGYSCRLLTRYAPGSLYQSDSLSCLWSTLVQRNSVITALPYKWKKAHQQP